MSQHRNWSPDLVYFEQDALILDYGSSGTSKSFGVATSLGGIGLGSSKTRYKQHSNMKKFFYSQNDLVSITPWKRKFRQWYLVSFGKNHILYTRNIETALKVQYHLNYIIKYYLNNPAVDTQGTAINQEIKVPIEEKLLKVKELHLNGLLSDKEYTQKRQQIINQY